MRITKADSIHLFIDTDASAPERLRCKRGRSLLLGILYPVTDCHAHLRCARTCGFQRDRHGIARCSKSSSGAIECGSSAFGRSNLMVKRRGAIYRTTYESRSAKLRATRSPCRATNAHTSIASTLEKNCRIAASPHIVSLVWDARTRIRASRDPLPTADASLFRCRAPSRRASASLACSSFFCCEESATKIRACGHSFARELLA